MASNVCLSKMLFGMKGELFICNDNGSEKHKYVHMHYFKLFILAGLRGEKIGASIQTRVVI